MGACLSRQLSSVLSYKGKRCRPGPEAKHAFLVPLYSDSSSISFGTWAFGGLADAPGASKAPPMKAGGVKVRTEATESEESQAGRRVWAAAATVAIWPQPRACLPGGTHKDSKVEFPNHGMKELLLSRPSPQPLQLKTSPVSSGFLGLGSPAPPPTSAANRFPTPGQAARPTQGSYVNAGEGVGGLGLTEGAS